MTSPGRLGYPISDDTSEDESSQIRGLEEDRGIYHHEEVDVPPQFESDEDRPIKGLDPMNEPEEVVEDSAPLVGKSEEGDLEVEESDPINPTDGENITQENLDMIRKLENPHTPREDEPEPEPEEQEPDIIETSVAGYPSTSPPAYTPASPGRVDSPETEEKDEAEKPRGSINSLLLAKVAEPFSALMKGGSQAEDDMSDEEEQLHLAELTEDELNVTDLIFEYSPEVIELKPMLRPFILDFIPAIGDIDAFIKVPRPDEVEDNIGLTELDEPAVKQSDPTILDMQMRSAAKEVTTQDDAPVKRLERADKNTDEIESWITNIKELHRSRPAQSVQYKGGMPDIEKLMQEWSPEVEKALTEAKLPTADLDVSLEEYADICMNLVDIPAGKSRIHGLHLFFSLYNEFKNSQHFRNLAQNHNSNSYQDTTDRLEL